MKKRKVIYTVSGISVCCALLVGGYFLRDIIDSKSTNVSIPATQTSTNEKSTKGDGFTIQYDALQIQVDRVFNVSGDVQVWLTVKNVSKKTVLITPKDFSVADDFQHVISADPISDESFKVAMLNPNESTKGILDFKIDHAELFHQLNYNGASGAQVVQIGIPSTSGGY